MQRAFVPDFEESEPPLFFRIYEAAKVLGCSFIELYEHPECTELVSFAFTIQRGENTAAYLNQLNPNYWFDAYSFAAEVEKVREVARKRLK